MKKLVAIVYAVVLSSLVMAQPNWSVNSANYTLDFTINGQVNFNGMLSLNDSDMVAAFDQNGIIKGVANLAFNATTQDYRINMTVFSNVTGDTISFKLYHAVNDTIYNAVNNPIIFTPNQIIGSLTSPYILYNNNTPTNLSLNTNLVTENNALGTYIGSLSTILPLPYLVSISYSLENGVGSNDNASFSISKDSLFANKSFDFEIADSLNVRIQSATSGGDTIQQPFVINVLDLNEVPTNIQLSNDSINENNGFNSYVGTLTTQDVDFGDIHQYSIDSLVGTDFGDFTLSNDSLFIVPSTDFETKNLFSVNLTSVDSGGLSVQKTFSISIQDVYEPTVISLTDSSVNENNAQNTFIGTLSNSNNYWNYSYVVNNTAFVINNDSLFTDSIFNNESLIINPISLNITSTDDNGNNETFGFNIYVNNVNESPTSLMLSNDSINENNAIGDAIGVLSTIDEDVNETFTYSIEQRILTDYTEFSIKGDTLIANANFDYELKRMYSIIIRVTDKNGASITAPFNVVVKDIYEQTFITLSSRIIYENAPKNLYVGTFSNTGNGVYKYQFRGGAGSANNSSFSISNDSLFTDSTFNFENLVSNPLSIKVQSTDTLNNKETDVFTIIVNDVNEAPVTILAKTTLFAETTAVNSKLTTLNTVDNDSNDVFSYTINPKPGTDYTAFVLHNDTLINTMPFDYETKNLYNLNVTTTDLGGLQITNNLTIDISDVYESTTISISNSTINENNIAGAFFGTLSNTEHFWNYTYQLDTGLGSVNNGLFSISNDSLFVDSILNFETIANPLSIKVSSADDSLNYESAVFLITINNENDLQTSINLSDNSYTENNVIGDSLASFSTIDEDAGEVFAYTIEPNPATDFKDFIISNGILKPFVSFDYELKKQYTIDVSSTDIDGNKITQTFDINVLDDPSDNNVSVNNNLQSSNIISVYPNPCSDFITVSLNEFEDAQITILSVNGTVVFSKQAMSAITKFSVSHLTPGTYFTQIVKGDRRSVKRIEVQ